MHLYIFVSRFLIFILRILFTYILQFLLYTFVLLTGAVNLTEVFIIFPYSTVVWHQEDPTMFSVFVWKRTWFAKLVRGYKCHSEGGHVIFLLCLRAYSSVLLQIFKLMFLWFILKPLKLLFSCRFWQAVLLGMDRFCVICGFYGVVHNRLFHIDVSIYWLHAICGACRIFRCFHWSSFGCTTSAM